MVFEKRGSCQHTRIRQLKEDIQGSNKSSELSDTFIINIVMSHFETSTRNNDIEIPKILLKNEIPCKFIFECLIWCLKSASSKWGAVFLFSFISGRNLVSLLGVFLKSTFIFKWQTIFACLCRLWNVNVDRKLAICSIIIKTLSRDALFLCSIYSLTNHYKLE